ncbi:MAG: TonB family protein [candidate division Zixibacteria bacterium]|nr:TonB family protein [candidate division Zixibacteria bacterium]
MFSTKGNPVSLTGIIAGHRDGEYYFAVSITILLLFLLFVPTLLQTPLKINPSGVTSFSVLNLSKKLDFIKYSIPIFSPPPFQPLDPLGQFGIVPVAPGEFDEAGNATTYISDCRRPDTNTYTASDSMLKHPELIWMKQLDYAGSSAAAGVKGEVTISILVDEQGQPLNIKVISEKPEKLGLGQSAVVAAQTAVFCPAVRNKCRVKCWVQLPIEIVMK